MKKVKYLLFLLCTFLFGLGICNAASISVSSSAREVNVGSTFNVTVTVNNVGKTAGSVGAWKYCVDYNSTNLTLVSPSNPCVNDGLVDLRSASTTFTFKANTSATTTIGLTGVLLYDYDSEQPMAVDKGSVQVKAVLADSSRNITPNNASSNANLRVLEVVGYQIVPEFNKNTTEYTLEVPGDVNQVQVNAYREDNNATTTPIDMVDLEEGINKVTVTITAPKGNKKTYTILITRGEINPILVNIDGKEYSVVNKEGVLELPEGFTATTITIGENEVKAYKNDQTGITLVVLKDQEGNSAYYMYKDGNYTLYNIINSKQLSLVITKYNKLIKGYENSKTININDKKVTVYFKNTNDTVVLIYGMNINTSEESWYYYDTEDGLMFKYMEATNTDNTKISTPSRDTDYKLLALVFAILSGLTVLLILVLLMYNSRLKKKNDDLFKYMESRMEKHRDKKFNKLSEKDIEKSDFKTFVDIDKTQITKTRTKPLFEDDIETTKELERAKKVEEIDDNELIEEVNNDNSEIILDLDSDFEEEKNTKKKKNNDPTLISDTDIVKNIARANAESFKDAYNTKKLSKKEVKQIKKKEKANLKKAQREFLNDETFEESAFDLYEREETEIIQTPVKKPKTKAKTTAKKKKK